MEPPALGGGGAGPHPRAHGLFHTRPGGGRPLRGRLRPVRPHACPGRYRHPRTRQRDGGIGRVLPARPSRSDPRRRRRPHHQRPVGGHGPPERLHGRDPGLRRGSPGGPLRRHQPHRRRGRPGLRGRRQPGVRRGRAHPHRIPDARRPGGRNPHPPRPRQRARPRRGPGRPLLPRRLQPHRLRATGGDDGRVRSRFPGSAGRDDRLGVTSGNARAHPRPPAGHLHEPHAHRRLRPRPRPGVCPHCLRAAASASTSTVPRPCPRAASTCP